MKANNMPKVLAGVLAVAIALTPVIQTEATGSTYSDNSYYGGTGSNAGGSSIIDNIYGGQTGTTEDGNSYLDSVVPTPQATAMPTPTAAPTPAVTPTPSASPRFSSSPTPQGGLDGREDEAAGTSAPEISPGEVTPTPGEKQTPGNKDSAHSAARIPDKDKVAGKETTITGVYLATEVDGCAVITDQEKIRQNYELTEKEELFAKFVNLNGVESPVSKKMLDLAAESQKAEVCAWLGIEIGKMVNGSYSLLSSKGANIGIMLGIPESGKNEEQTYAMICVRKDGTVYILEDQDSDPDTITFSTTGGAGAYALIRY